MRVPRLLFCVCLVASCVEAPPTDQFSDRGHGVWQVMANVPALRYEAIWGSAADNVYAVGDGGIAHHSVLGWQPVEQVPIAHYRTVWGRSRLEVWVGGDNVLLARSLNGWQEQTLWRDGQPIEEFSVLSLFGAATAEYAIVFTGGRQLLMRNLGSHWEAISIRAGAPMPLYPSVVISHRGNILIAGEGDLAFVRYEDWAWHSRRWVGWCDSPFDQPALTTLSRAGDGWVSAGGSKIFIYQDGDDCVTEIQDQPETTRGRQPLGSYAVTADRFWVVGKPIELRSGDPISGVLSSPIEACSRSACALEAVASGAKAEPLNAVWGNGSGTVMAVGNGVILKRGGEGTVK